MAASGGEKEPIASAQQPSRLWQMLGSYRSRLMEEARFGTGVGPRCSGIIALSRTPRGEQIGRDVTRDFRRQPPQPESSPSPERPI